MAANRKQFTTMESHIFYSFIVAKKKTNKKTKHCKIHIQY